MILITAENTTTAHINEPSKTTDSSLIRYMLLGKLYTWVIIIESKMNRVRAYITGFVVHVMTFVVHFLLICGVQCARNMRSSFEEYEMMSTEHHERVIKYIHICHLILLC